MELWCGRFRKPTSKWRRIYRCECSEGGNDSDTTSEDCELFHDSDYPTKEDNMILDKINNSIIESVSVKGNYKKNQICKIRKSIEFEFISNIQEKFSSQFTWRLRWW